MHSAEVCPDTIHTGAGDFRDVMLGDNGKATFDASGVLIEVTSTSPTIGGDDSLTSTGGDNVAVGGRGNDQIVTAAFDTTDGDNLVLGDSGILTFDNNSQASVVRRVESTDHSLGHNDDITTGHGNDVVIASSGLDIVDSSEGRDAILGDNGVVEFDVNGSLTLITTVDSSVGGEDTVLSGPGNDIVFGGADDDRIESMSGDDIVLGDAGEASFLLNAFQHIETLDQTIGGDDVILGGEDDDILIGGTADDILLGGTNGDDVILGDNGTLFGDNNLPQANDIITTGFTLGGGSDGILDEDGTNIIIGGDANDNLTGGSQTDWIAGDYADFIRGPGFVPQEFVSVSDSQGGNDGISGKSGWDLIVAGAGDDIASGHSGRDIVVGDNARATWGAGSIQRIESTSTNIGGNDTLYGNSNHDLIVGGFGEDNVDAGTDNDFVFGDNAVATVFANHTVEAAEAIASANGGNDTLAGAAGHDFIVGGTADDQISGGSEHDVIFGDHARFDSTLPLDQNFESIFTSAVEGGGIDTIHGDAGDDFVIGGQAGDQLFGDDGEDDITGGHNVRFGADGDDTIDGGSEADVILGDNGQIHRTLTPGTFDQWQQYPAPFADVIRTVTRFDDIDRVTGNDTITAGTGDDRVYGQRGDDDIDGGAGDDELIGHLGNDLIQGGDDHDMILSDVGTVIRDFLDDGSPHIKPNGSWHRDVVLEEVGNIAGIIDMDQTPLRVDDPALAQKLVTTDVLVLAAGLTALGDNLNNADNGAWDTNILLVDLLAGNNDVVDGGAGDDHIFGQRGDDNLSGGADNDYIFGDNLTNSIAHRTELPKATLTYRLLETLDPGIVPDEAGSVIVTPVMQVPEEMDLNNPYLLPDLFGNVWHEVVGENASHAQTLTRTDGTQLKPVIGIIPDVVHHVDVLPGNDTISGDDGNDFIVADNANAYSPLITGFDPIEDAGNLAEQTRLALARTMHSLGLLSVDYLRTTGAAAGVPHDVVVASDSVDGGAGNDHIIGDDGMIVADLVLGLPADTDNLATAATSLAEYLADVRQLATEFEYVTFEAHYQVLTQLLGGAGNSADAPDFHELFIGNDTLVGGDDDDTITGDHTAILTDVVDGQQFNTVGEDVPVATWTSVANALTSQIAARNTQLANHVNANHNTSNRTLTAAQLASLPIDFEYDRSIGNDDIQSGSGDDLIVGDFGAYAFPVLETLPLTFNEEQDTGRDVDKLTSGMARWLEQQHHESGYEVRITVGYDHPLYEVRGGDSVQWATLAGNDTIDAGDDNDFVLSDSFSISTNLVADDLVARFSEAESQFKVGFLDRSNFEITEQYVRFGGASVFGNDTVRGGAGNDILFGQTQSNALFGDAGDDELFGGEGPANTADGGTGGGTARAGSALNPTDVWIDILEDYQFGLVASLTTQLATDIFGSHDLSGEDHEFDILLGNFIGQSASDATILAIAQGTTRLVAGAN